MSAPHNVLQVGVRLEVCTCGEFGVPHAYLFLDRNVQPEPASFSLQLMLVHLGMLVEWATDHDVAITPDPENILHTIQHAELPVESPKDEEVFEALRENGGSTEAFVCERAKRQAFAFHNVALRMAS